MDAARFTKKAYPSSAVMPRAFSHAEICAEELQQLVSTSSPPRCKNPSGKRPDGTCGFDAAPPVISWSSPVIRSKVALLATLSGCVHVALGQTSGYPLHHDACEERARHIFSLGARVQAGRRHVCAEGAGGPGSGIRDLRVGSICVC
eukprot:4379790-Prymnesium_polylepis.2